jgi:septin family protein
MHKDPVVCKGKLNKIIDNRVHLVLYFFTANRVKQTDVTFLKELAPMVNIMPIIAMAD